MKTYIFRSLLFLFFLSVVHSLSFGQIDLRDTEDPPPPSDPPISNLGNIRNDPGGTGLEPIKFTPYDCFPEFPIQVRLANLVPIDPEDDDTDYQLPEGVPSIWLEYSIYGSPITRVELTAFQPIGTAGVTEQYEMIVTTAPINITAECGLNENGEGVINTNLIARLVKNEEGAWVDYPACEHNEVGEIFACNYFYWAGLCQGLSGAGYSTGKDKPNAGASTRNEPTGPPAVECNNNLLTNFDVEYILYCAGGCSNAIGPGSGYATQGNNGYDLSKVSVTPNPFTNDFRLDWAEKETMTGLKLFGFDGNLINSWSQDQLNEITSLRIDAFDLPKGIYYLKAKSEETTKVIKILKQ